MTIVGGNFAWLNCILGTDAIGPPSTAPLSENGEKRIRRKVRVVWIHLDECPPDPLRWINDPVLFQSDNFHSTHLEEPQEIIGEITINALARIDLPDDFLCRVSGASSDQFLVPFAMPKVANGPTGRTVRPIPYHTNYPGPRHKLC